MVKLLLEVMQQIMLGGAEGGVCLAILMTLFHLGPVTLLSV